MARDDWFRHTTWDDRVEAAFNAKLQRARAKDQYLRIQAHSLVATHPDVTLHLINRYFELGSTFFDAAALCDRAEALINLERYDEAYEAYELALKSESEFPGLKTNAHVDYPFLIAERKVRAKYELAVRILEERAKDLAFPVNKFKWNAAQALICWDLKRIAEARGFAQAAIEAAGMRRSEFQKHRALGLVGEEHASHLREIEKMLEPNPRKKILGIF